MKQPVQMTGKKTARPVNCSPGAFFFCIVVIGGVQTQV